MPTDPQTSTPGNPTPSAAAPNHDHGALAAAVRVVSGFTLLSRFAGLARDVLTAHLFGNTLIGSAFASAFAIPNLFRRLFGEGALSAAFIPEYVKARKADPEVARRFSSQVVSLLLAVSGGITLLGVIVLLVMLSTSLGNDAERRLSFQLVAVMLPMMPMVCLTAILGGMLQVQGKFGPPAAAPIILNIFQIVTGAAFFFYFKNQQVAAAFGVGIAAGVASIVQVIWSIAALRESIKFTQFRADPATAPHTAAMFKNFVPALIGLGTIQINSMLDQLWGMWPIWVGDTMLGFKYPLDDTSNGILGYAGRLYQFPLGVFGIAVATAVLPLLARHAQDDTNFGSVLRRGLRLSLFIGLPASLGLVLVREPIVAVLFSGSKTGFDAEGLTRASAVLTGFAPGVWAYSLNHVLTRAFYAKGDTRTPMFISIAMVVLNLILNLTLIWPLKEAGLAWATGISAIIQTVVLAIFVKRKFGITALDFPTVRGMFMVCLAGTIMTLLVYGTLTLCTRMLFKPSPPNEQWFANFLTLSACTIAGIASFAVASYLFKLPELKWLFERAPKDANGKPIDISFD